MYHRLENSGLVLPLEHSDSDYSRSFDRVACDFMAFYPLGTSYSFEGYQLLPWDRKLFGGFYCPWVMEKAWAGDGLVGPILRYCSTFLTTVLS